MLDDPRRDVDPASDSSFDVAGTVAMLRRQSWVIGGTVAAMVIAAAASLFLSTAVYASSAEVVVEPVRWGAESAFADSNLVPQDLATQRLIATSEQVATRVAEELGGGVTADDLRGRVSAQQLGESRVLRITARDDDPERASEIAQAFAEQFLESRREEVAGRVEEATADLQARMDEVRTRIAELEEELQGEGQTGPGSAARIRERDSLLEQLGQISTELTSLEASGAVAQTGGEVIGQPSVPSSPVSPQAGRRIALGLLVGGVLGLAVGWVRDRLLRA